MIVRSTHEVEEQLERAQAAVRRWSGENGNPLKLHIALGMAMALSWMLDTREGDNLTRGLEDE